MSELDQVRKIHYRGIHASWFCKSGTSMFVSTSLVTINPSPVDELLLLASANGSSDTCMEVSMGSGVERNYVS